MPEEQTQVTEGGQATGGTTLTQGAVGGSPQAQVAVTDWKTSIPDEIRKEKSLEGIKDIGSLAKSYVEAQKMIGSTIRMPKEDAKPEEWEAFYKKLGRPDKSEEYQVELPELPGGKTWEPERVEELKVFAHENGLTPKQAQAVFDYMADLENSRVEESEKQLGDNLSSLQKEWGPTFKRKVVMAQRAVKEFGDPEIIKTLDDTGLGNNPAMIRLFAQIGETLAEDGIISGAVQGEDGVDSAKAKINQIASDKKHPLWDETNPAHKAAVEEWTKLHQMAFK